MPIIVGQPNRGNLTIGTPSGGENLEESQQLIVEVVEPAPSSVTVTAGPAVAQIIGNGAGIQGPPGRSADDLMPYQVKVDDIGGGITYVGYADATAETSDAAWQIIRIVESGDPVDLSKTYANSLTTFAL